MYLLQRPTDYHFILFLETAFLWFNVEQALVVFLYLQPPMFFPLSDQRAWTHA